MIFINFYVESVCECI